MTPPKTRSEDGQGDQKQFSALVSQLIRANRDLWDETKADFAHGFGADSYGSAIGIMVQAAAQNVLNSLSPAERTRLEDFAMKRIPSNAPDRSCSALMTHEWMVRANRSVSRNGYYG